MTLNTSSPSIKILGSLDYIEASSRIVADTLKEVSKYIAPGVTTLELDAIAEDYIRSHGGEPAFKGYNVHDAPFAFPASLCISIDDEVVHGIPSSSRKLVEGQIVSVDCGVRKDGYYGDSAYTFPVGTISPEKQRLLEITKESLKLGVEQAVVGNKVYDIARAVQQYVERNGCSIVRDLVGHGVGKRLHEDPAIPNFVPALLHRNKYPNDKLRKGQTLAIEPMVNYGTFRVVIASDGWTVLTADHQPSAHFEHTVAVDNNHPIVFTHFEV